MEARVTAQKFTLLRQKVMSVEAKRLLRWPVVVALATAICAVLVFLFFGDPLVIAPRKYMPHWCTVAGRFFNHFGNGYNVYVPLAVGIVLLTASARLELSRFTHGLLTTLAVRLIYLIAAIGASGLVSTLAKWIFGRVRPKLAQHTTLDFSWFTWTFDGVGLSFPSGHSTVAFSTAFALGTLMPSLRLPLFVVAGLVGVSRVVLGAHFPSDVLAGALCGVVVSALVSRAFARQRLALVVTEQGTIAPKPWPRLARHAALAGALFDKLRGRPPAQVAMQPTGWN